MCSSAELPIDNNTWIYTDHVVRCYTVALGHNELTHLPLDKMAAISQTIFLDAFSWLKIFVLIKISLKFVPEGPMLLKITQHWFR